MKKSGPAISFFKDYFSFHTNQQKYFTQTQARIFPKKATHFLYQNTRIEYKQTVFYNLKMHTFLNNNKKKFIKSYIYSIIVCIFAVSFA